MRRTFQALTLTVSTLSLLLATSAARAGSELQPGITNGLAIVAPLPEGVYDIVIGNYGARSTSPATDLGVGVPSWLIWSTPWTLLGGRVGFDATNALVHVSSAGSINKNWAANTLLQAELKFDLGNGFSSGLIEGVYLPGGAPLNNAFASFQQIVGLNYIKDGWKLLSTGIFGTGQNGTVPGHYAPNWINYELTAIRSFGKWDLGFIAYGSADLNSPNATYQMQSQFAVGGLIGYDFGPLIAQVKVTRDVAEKNYGGYDTRFWTNIIIPLWTAPATVAARY
jgi:hypothetical protein